MIGRLSAGGMRETNFKGGNRKSEFGIRKSEVGIEKRKLERDDG